MIGLNYKLEKLERDGTPILAGIVGAGQMGRGLVAQMISMKGMRPAVVADRTLEKAAAAFRNAGLQEGKDFRTATTAQEAESLLREGILVAAGDSGIIKGCESVRCVVEATGVPEAGTKVALEAIQSKKHIVMLNVETDVCVGHILFRMAAGAGVVYTGSAGDEPGAVIELFDFAKALGFDVRVIGKGKNNPIDYGATPASVAEEAARRGVSPKMLCSFKDGTKTMVEMTCMANATGFLPDVMGAHGPKSTLKELVNVLSLKSEGRGGVLGSYGVVEYIDGVAPGVFAIISTNQPDIMHELAYLTMGDGPNYCLFRPYHLCSLETPISVARACIDGEPTIIPRAGLVAETCAVAKTNLKAGDVLDGIGGYTVRGAFVSAAEAREKNALPIGLVNGNTVMARDVATGGLITYADVKLDEDSPVVALRRRQDAMFAADRIHKNIL